MTKKQPSKTKKHYQAILGITSLQWLFTDSPAQKKKLVRAIRRLESKAGTTAVLTERPSGGRSYKFVRRPKDKR